MLIKLKRKLYTIFLTLVLFICLNHAQNQNFDWAYNVGGIDYDRANEVTTDNQGNVITVGNFINVVDFDPSSGVYNLSSSFGSIDAFVTKTNSSGQLIWAKSIGGMSTDDAFNVITDEFNNIIICGNALGNVDFDPGPAINIQSISGAYILKLDSLGNFIWVKKFQSSVNAVAGISDITINKSGELNVTGEFCGFVDFDPSNSNYYMYGNTTNYETYILKLNSQGNFMWAKKFSTFDYNRPFAISTDSKNNILISGTFAGTHDFNPDTTIAYNLISSGLKDGYFVKLDSNGVFIFAKQIEGILNQIYHSLGIDKNDNILICGDFQGITDIDPSFNNYYLNTSGQNYGSYVSKYNSNGALIWAKLIESNRSTGQIKIKSDDENSIYLLGSFTVSVDADPNFNTSYYLYDSGIYGIGISLIKLDSTGSFIWGKSISSLGDEYGTSLTIDQNKNVYVTGNFHGNTNAGGLNTPYYIGSNGLIDGFIAKFSYCTLLSAPINTTSNSTICYNSKAQLSASGVGVLKWFNALGSFVSIGNNYTTSSLQDTTFFIVRDSNSCGLSNPSLKVVVNVSDSINKNLSINNTTITANQIGAVYQWYNCNTNSIIQGQTNQNYTATQNGNYACIITTNNCSDTSICVNITNIGLKNTTNNVNRIFVFPNPTKNEISINTTISGSFNLVNELGQTLKTLEIKANTNNTFDLSDLMNGVYYLVGENGVREKIVVLK